jgi:NADH-quinone oxidoreductase subunit J
VADLVVFWIFAVIAVAAGIGMLLVRNAVHSALLLIVTQFCIAIFFLELGSPFLFVVQLIVYAGAIMVLFLFVIMLLGVDGQESLRERLAAQRWLALVLGVALIVEVIAAVHLGIGLSNGGVPNLSHANAGGNVEALARVLFGPYFFPFEVTSILLIVAAIGIMLHGRRTADMTVLDADDEAIPPDGAGGPPGTEGVAEPALADTGAAP